MAEDTPYVPPGAEDEESSDVLGKLDELLNRHKPKPRAEAEAVPILTDVLPEEDSDAIPTLTDIVSGPGSPPREAAAQRSLEGGLVQRLGMRLEVERARLLGEGAGTPGRAEVLDELVNRLRESLPDIVQVALSREERKSAPKPNEPTPDDQNR
ncbi:MAG TPA: hypothetical protein VF460_13705 [Burkholderiales bacterium]